MLFLRSGAVLLSTFTASAFSPARPESRHDVEYARIGDTSLRMDVRTPAGAGPFPAVVIVHGGGWVTGDRKNNVGPLFPPLEAAGFASFSISYRLAGNMFMFGDAVEDVVQAVQHIRLNAATYHVDPDRIALIGESAGGQLASMAALSPEIKGMLRGVVAIYSPSDLVTLAKTARQIPEELRRSMAGSPFAEMLLEGLRRLSPIQHVRADMPPFLLIHGTADALVPFEQSKEMCSRMLSAGALCELIAVDGGGHGIRWWEGNERMIGYKVEMVRWLKDRLLYKG